MAHPPVGMILCAGFGTRLLPLTHLRPKPIIEIAGKPIIYYLIRMLEKAGIRDVIVNLHHHAHQIDRYLSTTKFSARLHRVYEREILGTAGGVSNAINQLHLGKRPMVIIHGDIACDIDLAPFIEDRNFCTMICAQDQEVLGYVGSVGVDGDRNIIELGQFFSAKKPIAAKGFFTGIQILSAEAMALLQNSTANSLVKDVYAGWLKEGRAITGITMPLVYDDLGSPDRLFHTNMSILGGQRFRNLDVFEGLREDHGPGVWCGNNVSIHETARVIAPAIIGDGTRIGEGARVGPHAVIGAHVVIESGATITNTVILSGTHVEKDEDLNCMIGLSSARVVIKSS